VPARLVIVDDDPGSILFIQKALSGMGDIFFSVGSDNALDVIRNNKPDIILLDVQMPDRDGFDLCTAISGDPACGTPHVILMTASMEPGSEVRGLAAGAADFLTKPLDPTVIRARVQTHLALKRRNDALLADVRSMNAALRENRDQFEIMTANLPSILYQHRLHPDGHSDFPYISDLATSTFGLYPKQLKEDASSWFEFIHPDERERFFAAREISARKLTPFRHEFRATVPGIGIRWMRNESRPQRLDDGCVVWSGHMIDITERRKARERAHRQSNLYRALSETNEAVLRFQDEPVLFALVSRIAVDYGGMVLAWVGIPDDSGRIVPVSSSGKAIGYLKECVVMANVDVAEGRGPAGSALREEKTVIVSDVSSDASTAPWADLAERFGIRTIASFPIVKGRKTYAVLSIYSDHVGAFDDDTIHLIQRVVANIGFALDNIDREAERRKAELALQLTQYSVDKAVDPLLWIDKDATIRFVNDAACTYLGYSRDEMLSLKITDLDPALTMEIWARVWEQEKILTSRKIETWHRSRDGRMIPVEITSSRVEYEGKEYKFVFVRDISDRKQSEERERRLKNLYRALSEANEAILHLQDESALFPLICRIAVDYGGMPLAWVCALDDENHFIPAASHGKIARRYTENIKFSLDKRTFRSPIATAYLERRSVIVNDIARDEMMAPWRNKALSENLRSNAHIPILKDGSSYAVLVVYSHEPGAFDARTVRLLEDMASNIGFALDNFDREAERRKTEIALRLTQFTLDKSADPIFWICQDGRIRYVNDAACSYLGYSRDEMLNMSVCDISHSVTADIWAMYWDENSRNKSMKLEDTHRAKDGRIIPVEINATRIEYGGEEYDFAFVRDISERKRTEEMIWRQANYDELTGQPNRRLFMERLDREIMRSRRTNLPLALLFLDLDHFKDVNDTLGHGKGDLLLKKAADRIVTCVRKTDTVARFGGDEFTLILTDLADTGSVERIAESILKKLADPFVLEDEVVYISGSIGITFCPNDASDSENLLKNADQAMYNAKSLGRSRAGFYDASLQQAALSRHQLIKHLHAALADGQFEVFYQPIVDLANGTIRKAEALLRWRHPERGMISPAELIPLAEQTGMIVEIGDWVFRQAAQEVRNLRDRHHTDFQISINKSAVQFRNDAVLYKTWFSFLHELGLDGDSIVIEITESLLMDSGAAITSKIDAFREAGMKLSLDDFGTGYSSLSYLKRFELDFLKIDQSFVRNLTAESDDMVLCEAIIALAHKLGIKVVAEGVETEEQRALLAGGGCDFAQGYLFSRPIPAAELEQLLQSMSQAEKSPVS